MVVFSLNEKLTNPPLEIGSGVCKSTTTAYASLIVAFFSCTIVSMPTTTLVIVRSLVIAEQWSYMASLCGLLSFSVWSPFIQYEVMCGAMLCGWWNCAPLLLPSYSAYFSHLKFFFFALFLLLVISNCQWTQQVQTTKAQ